MLWSMCHICWGSPPENIVRNRYLIDTSRFVVRVLTYLFGYAGWKVPLFGQLLEERPNAILLSRHCLTIINFSSFIDFWRKILFHIYWTLCDFATIVHSFVHNLNTVYWYYAYLDNVLIRVAEFWAFSGDGVLYAYREIPRPNFFTRIVMCCR